MLYVLYALHSLYALHESLLMLQSEGLENNWSRPQTQHDKLAKL